VRPEIWSNQYVGLQDLGLIAFKISQVWNTQPASVFDQKCINWHQFNINPMPLARDFPVIKVQ
jgi:hypothetical protein